MSPVSRKISYFDGLQFVDAKDREQPLPPTAVVGFRSEGAGVLKDRSPAANIDVNRALISFKEMPITQLEANHDALKVDAKDREQPLPPTAVVGFRSEGAGVAKDRSPAANIDANRALISFKEMPITQVEAKHDALKVSRGEIGRLAVEPATLVNDFEGRQNPALLDIVEFDGFIWEPDRNRRH